MRIGIITFWESNDNYGQVLQAYALQQVLKSMGHEPFQIRYSIKASQIAEKRSPFFKKILKALLIYPLIKSIKRRKALKEDAECRLMIEKKNEVRKFLYFRSIYIEQSTSIYNSIEEIRSNPPVADCYITGSDQVWTMLLSNEGNAAYFLDFGVKNVKRISYAASFGRSEYPKKLFPRLKELLTRFDAISVREQEGIEICNSLGFKAEHVLDPTLLLSKEDYLSNLHIEDRPKGNSLFVYSINVRFPKELYWSELQRYADANGLDITVTTSSGNIPGREIYDGVNYSYATIEEWLMKINKAQLVATTSFHGVVFCLLMHTNFVYVPLRNSRAKGNGRVESLLKTMNLLEKICYKSEDINICSHIAIDWTMIDSIMQRNRINSISFLQKNL